MSLMNLGNLNSIDGRWEVDVGDRTRRERYGP